MPTEPKPEPQVEIEDMVSEACLDELERVVHWELQARIAVGDDPRTEAADSALDYFELRRRTKPRYRFPPEAYKK